MDSLKETALRRRLEDTGWGRAIAHDVPFYALYYAITRRTITPLIYCLAGNLFVYFMFLVAYVGAPPGSGGYVFLTIAPWIFWPFLAKIGIDQSRTYAKAVLRLNEPEDSRLSSNNERRRGPLGLQFGDSAKADYSNRLREKPQPFGINFDRPEMKTSIDKRQAFQNPPNPRIKGVPDRSAPPPEWGFDGGYELAIQKNEARKINQPKVSQPQENQPEEKITRGIDDTSDIKAIDNMELALKRYLDLYEKGLIEKDEYDALRKREMGI